MFAQAVFAAFLAGGFVACKDGVVVGLAGFKQMEDDTGELVGGGGDGLGCAKARAHAPEVFAEGGVAFAGAVGGHAKGEGRAALHAAGMSGEDLAAGDSVVRAKAKPGGEVF